MIADMGACFVIYANENQAGVHYAMPVRNMLYDALDYADQIKELEKRHKEAGDKLGRDEFLSGITKEDRIIPVITTVLFYGKTWDGCKSLYEMMGMDGESEEAGRLKRYLPDYKINLFHAAGMADIKVYRTCLQQIFGMLKYNSDKKKLYEYVRQNREKIERMSDAAVSALIALLGEQKRLAKLWEEKKEQEGFSMCQAIDELIQDGIEQGLEQGMKNGMRKGLEQGVRKGENRFAGLILQLAKANRLDLIEKAASDEMLRLELYKKYGIE